MPALIAAPWLGTAIAGIAGGTGAIVGAKMQSGAVDRSAKTQATAATEGARIEDQAAQRREAFERQQAQAQWADAEAARKANYDQWGARQRALNAFRQKYGYAPMEIPEYVHSQDPRYGGDGSQTPPSTGRPVNDGPFLDPTQPFELENAETGERISPPRGGGPPQQPQRQPMGAVGSYLPQQQSQFQSYAPQMSPYGAMSVDAYLRTRR